MVTLEQAKEYLTSQGVTLPDFLLQALVDQVNTIEPCLTEHYPASTAMLIQLYVLGLMGLSQGDKYISSQTAPSGASQSFRHAAFENRWNGLTNLLAGIDPFGCATPITPTNPQAAFGGLWNASGACGCGGA